MTHWRFVLLIRILMEIDYETIVSERLDATRRLDDFLGPPSNDACLRCFEIRRPVNTVSLVQVRRSIYRSGIARSASLLPYLTPPADAMGDLVPRT